MIVRPPRPGDAPGLARATCDAGEQYARLEPDRFRVPELDAQIAWYEEKLARPSDDASVWLVAEVDGEAVGEAHASLHEPMVNAEIRPQLDFGRPRVYLNYLAVQAAHRSKGVGGALLAAVEDWARARGAELIGTDTNLRSNVGAVEFYESNGYVQQGVVLRKVL